MRRDAGMSLIELMLVLGLAAVVTGTALVYSVRWMAQETAHAAAKDVQAFLQLTKIEAISRNRPCRLVVDPSARTLEVWDSAGTPGDASDDRLLHTHVLPRVVRFARPDRADQLITLAVVDGADSFQATFGSDGIVTAGNGLVHLQGGEQFSRVTLYLAGGVDIETWNGLEWEPAS